MTTLRFVPLAPGISEEITEWFEDPDTVRYLGGRDWLMATLRFERPEAMPVDEIAAVHTWIVLSGEQPLAVVRVDVLTGGRAAIELAVAPTRRRSGIGKKVLAALWDLPELAGVGELHGEIDAEHVGAAKLAAAAGFDVVPDAAAGRVHFTRVRPTLAHRDA